MDDDFIEIEDKIRKVEDSRLPQHRDVCILGRCEASWGEPERDMTISTRLSDSVFTETHGLENALKSEYE